MSNKLLSKSHIIKIVQTLGREITQDYSGKVSEETPLVVIGLLKGSFIFMADLIREIDLPLVTDFMLVSSYKDNKQGELNIILGNGYDLNNSHILLVDDIIDSGLTFIKVLEKLKNDYNMASLNSCTLISKYEWAEFVGTEHIDCKYVGHFLDTTKFIYGYGMDSNELYRNLPEIYEED